MDRPVTDRFAPGQAFAPGHAGFHEKAASCQETFFERPKHLTADQREAQNSFQRPPSEERFLARTVEAIRPPTNGRRISLPNLSPLPSPLALLPCALLVELCSGASWGSQFPGCCHLETGLETSRPSGMSQSPELGKGETSNRFRSGRRSQPGIAQRLVYFSGDPQAM